MTTTCDYCNEKLPISQAYVVDVTWKNGMKGHKLVVCKRCMEDLRNRAARVIEERNRP